MRTELSPTAAVSDVRHHGLITRVGLVSDPAVPRMHAELLRTTLLAFLAFPELAHQAFYAACPGEDPPPGTPEKAARQVLGWYRLRDVATRPARLNLVRALAGDGPPAARTQTRRPARRLAG